MPQHKICSRDLKLDLVRLKEHYKFMLENSKQSFNGYIKSKVVDKKEWLSCKESCEVCLENQKVGPIPLKSLFPSGHLYPPAGDNCTCALIGITRKD